MSSVLIVDDDADIRLLLRLELSAEGHHISEAVNGKVALEAIEAERPDLVLLDIMMPVMDGWSVLEELRTLPAEELPRVVVVSARASVRDREKALELGADAFVAKPFNMDDLLGVVHELERAD